MIKCFIIHSLKVKLKLIQVSNSSALFISCVCVCVCVYLQTLRLERIYTITITFIIQNFNHDHKIQFLISPLFLSFPFFSFRFDLMCICAHSRHLIFRLLSHFPFFVISLLIKQHFFSKKVQRNHFREIPFHSMNSIRRNFRLLKVF